MARTRFGSREEGKARAATYARAPRTNDLLRRVNERLTGMRYGTPLYQELLAIHFVLETWVERGREANDDYLASVEALVDAPGPGLLRAVVAPRTRAEPLMCAPLRTVTGTPEPPAGPLPRADLVILLRTAAKLIGTLTTPVGGLFRRGYLQRLSDALEREDRFAPEPTAIVAMGRWVRRMERRGSFAALEMEAATIVLDEEAVRRAAVILGIRLVRDGQ